MVRMYFRNVFTAIIIIPKHDSNVKSLLGFVVSNVGRIYSAVLEKMESTVLEESDQGVSIMR